MAALNYEPMVAGMREVFMTGRTKLKSWREEQLKAILRMLTENSLELCDALYKDLKKVLTFTVDSFVAYYFVELVIYQLCELKQ